MNTPVEVIPVSNQAQKQPVKIFYTLVYLRKRAHLTQKELAAALDVAFQTVIFWETGRRTPSPENLQKIADYFEVTKDYLELDAPTVEIAKQVIAEQVMLLHEKDPLKLSDRDKNFLLQVIRTLTPQVLVEETLTTQLDEQGNKVRQRAVRKLAQFGVTVKQE